MKAKYSIISIALLLSSVFSIVYMKFFSKWNEDITIYVCQVGIYKEEVNANEMKQQLQGLEIPTYSYVKDDTFIVISDIFLEEEAAKSLGTTISEKQITCAIRTYQIPKELQPSIEAKEYEMVLKELEKAS